MLPGFDLAAADQLFLELASRQQKTKLNNALIAWLPARVAEAVVKALTIDGHAQLSQVSRDTRHRLIRALLNWSLPVRGSRGYNYAEVTAGGVPLSEIDPTSMASRKCPGLFLVGEILDVDGRIGGFNFQWSWSTGWVAARGVTDHFSSNQAKLH
jgi:predicted Rossmann fold flavoprotein